MDRDFVIPGLDGLLAKPSVAIARFIWRTMSSNFATLGNPISSLSLWVVTSGDW